MGRVKSAWNQITGSNRLACVMKTNIVATRAVAGILPAMALFATPALAQDVAQPAAPPVMVPVAPPVVAPAPQAASPATGGPSAEDRAKFEASAAAATGTAAAAGEAAPAEATTRRATARPVAAPPARVTRAAPVVAAPAAPVVAVAAPEPSAPAATTALPDAPMTTPIPEPTATAAPADTQATTTDTATTETTESAGVPLWGWLLGGLALLAAIGAFVALRRRREETVWEEEAVAYEPVHEQPVAAAPLAAAPVAAEGRVTEVVAEDHAEVVTPAAEEVSAITAAAAPVTGRPWIELSLRPVRAGATDESAIVDLELTLANAGEVAARNVRVSTFMLGDATDAPTDIERLLAHGHGGTEVNAGEIGAGEGSRVDASLTVSRDGMNGPTFQPIVVADVRYTLPDGGEGRTAAAFAVGGDDGTDEPTPLRLGGDMREDVAASLHGVPERA